MNDDFGMRQSNRKLPVGKSNPNTEFDREKRKYISNFSKPPSNLHKQNGSKVNSITPFHSALNPLDYYQDLEEEESKSNLKRLTEAYSSRNDEEMKYENNYMDHQDYNYDEDDAHSHDKYSSGSYEEESKYNQDSNRDKPRSFTNSTQNNNSRDFRSNNVLELTKSIKRDQDENHTLELSPDAACEKIMDEISGEMRRNYISKNSDSKSSHSRGKHSHEYNVSNSNKNVPNDQTFDNSREIIMSDDMKQNLNNVMEENSEDEVDEDSVQNMEHQQFYSQHLNKERRGSFGRPKNSESDRIATSSTPKMGNKTEVDKARESAAYNENNQRVDSDHEEHYNMYQNDSMQKFDDQNEIGLNVSNVDLKNHNFSDLVTNGKINREALIERINRHQAMFEEYSESNHYSYDSSNKKIEDNFNANSREKASEDQNVFASNQNFIGINKMHSKNLAKELIFCGRDIANRRNEKVNNSCIIVSKSQANLDGKSFEHHSSKDYSNVQSAFDLLIETLSALETDIAKNFKLISSKFSSFNQDVSKIKFDMESINDCMNSYEKKVESLETRLSYFSDRDDDILKMTESLSHKIQLQTKAAADIECKIHELELNRMADETSRAEILNSSFPANKEFDLIIKKIDEKVATFESRMAKDEDRIRKLESKSQTSNNEAYIDQRCDQIENDLREELDKVFEQFENAKSELKSDIAEEYINFEQYAAIEQQIKHLKISYGNLSGRIDGVCKELEQGMIKDNLKDDLNLIKDLSFNITKINNTFKEDVYRLEEMIKDNSVKYLGLETNFTTFKTEFDQKLSKSNFDSKSYNEKLLYLEELFNEMYEVIKKHNMQEKVSSLQQINQSMMYGCRESKTALLDKSMMNTSKPAECVHNCEIYVSRLMQEIYEKFSSVDKSIFNCLSLLEKEKGIIGTNEKKHKSLDTRVSQMEKEMGYLKERVQVLGSKIDMKHIRKHSSNKKSDVASMEAMIETQIYHELKKFDKVVEKMMNFEGKMYDIDNHLKTLESQIREGHYRIEDSQSHQESIQHLRNKNYDDKSDNDNYDDSSIWNRNADDKSSLNSAIKQFKENVPHVPKVCDSNPDLQKFVSNTQKCGRNTACEPTSRETDSNLIVEEKHQNASKRKSSMPNVPNYTKSTRNLRKGATSAFVNRHYSTERGNSGCTKDSVERNLTNTSCIVGTPQDPHSFMNISNPNSRQSNNYSGYALMNSSTDPNPQFFEALKRRGLERILKQA